MCSAIAILLIRSDTARQKHTFSNAVKRELSAYITRVMSMTLCKSALADIKQTNTVKSMLNRVNHKCHLVRITEEKFNRFYDRMTLTNSEKYSALKRSSYDYYSRPYRDRPKEVRLTKEQVKATIYSKRRVIQQVRVCFVAEKRERSLKEIKRELQISLNYHR